MSIFVDPNALISLNVRYLELKNEKDEVIGAKILPELSPIEENEKQIICEARGRDYETISNILEECTVINHITGKPMIRSKIFRRMVIECFFVSWNQYDSNETMIPITKITINNMFEQLVRALVNQWTVKTTG